MSIDGLTKCSLVIISRGYWQLCNEYFDRDVHTSDEMQREKRGNCFTLSEFLCNELVANNEALASGVCLEVLPSRRNYHASTWAVLEIYPKVVRLDLLDENPVPQPQLAEVASELISLANSSAEALYISTDPGTESGKNIVTHRSISEAYEWPEGPGRHEAVFLGASLGIKTLHTLAQLGGIKHLLDDPEQVFVGLPLLPS